MSKPKTKEEWNKDELLACLDEWLKYIKRHLGINSHSFKAYQKIYQIIQNQPEVVVTYHSGEKTGYKIQPEIDINEIIDCVLQNSYVVSEKTSDGTGREYYDNQLFPEKGCEEKVKKLIQGK